MVIWTSDVRGCNGFDDASYDFDLEGITVGGGIEFAIADNITMKLEYRYTSYEAVDIISGPPVSLDASPNVQTIRATLSYRTGVVPAATGGFEEAKWTGFHAGLGGGYGMVNHVLDASSTLGGGASLDFSGVGGEGFLGTAEIGADFQFGERFVVGIEGDYTLSGISTDIDGSITSIAGYRVGDLRA